MDKQTEAAQRSPLPRSFSFSPLVDVPLKNLLPSVRLSVHPSVRVCVCQGTQLYSASQNPATESGPAAPAQVPCWALEIGSKQPVGCTACVRTVFPSLCREPLGATRSSPILLLLVDGCGGTGRDVCFGPLEKSVRIPDKCDAALIKIALNVEVEATKLSVTSSD